MNLQQLEYILAVDECRHFVEAAGQCHVTQATLSMMIKKLEEELGVIIFDRSKQPVIPTAAGIELLAQARIVINEVRRMRELAGSHSGELKGELRLGIIPTLAPYLLPLFLPDFLRQYPNVKLKISEITTRQIIHDLQQHHLDAGLLATPLHVPSLHEVPLFYEQFVVYSSPAEKLMKKKFILADDIDVDRLWLLEEGHCLRSQVMNLCELRKADRELHNLDYQAGSLETLKKLVESNQGITILPELALSDLQPRQLKNVRYFRDPAPVREISLVTYRQYAKQKLVEALRKEILQHVPVAMQDGRRKTITEI